MKDHKKIDPHLAEPHSLGIDGEAAFLEAMSIDDGHFTPLAALWTPMKPERLSALLDGYQVVSFIGRGGMGAVYEAIQTSLDRVVAVKIFDPEDHGDRFFTTQFEREAKALAKLNHPNIVQIYDYGRTSTNLYYIAMEYVEGGNLQQSVRSIQLTPKAILSIMVSVLDALEYAHGEGFIHRDIKPANILMGPGGFPKIADFGLTRMISAETSPPSNMTAMQPETSGFLMGTPDYSSPEQITGLTTDQRTDLYSLGVMMYELLAGQLPRGNYTPLSRQIPGTYRLDAIVNRALSADPDYRFHTASEMKMAIGKQTATAKPAAALAHFVYGHASPWKLSAFIAIGIGSALALLMIFTYGKSGWRDADYRGNDQSTGAVIESIQGTHYYCWRGDRVEFRTTSPLWSADVMLPMVAAYDQTIGELARLTGTSMAGKKTHRVVYEAPPSLPANTYARLNPDGNVHLSQEALSIRVTSFFETRQVDPWLIDLALERVAVHFLPKIGTSSLDEKEQPFLARALVRSLHIAWHAESAAQQEQEQDTPSTIEKTERQAFEQFSEQQDITWVEFVMQGDMAFEGLRATPVDVLTGAFLELSDAHGGVTFLSEIMAQHLPLLPESSSDQESMLNLMDASEMAAGVDLSSFFTSKLHWPTSDAE